VIRDFFELVKRYKRYNSVTFCMYAPLTFGNLSLKKYFQLAVVYARCTRIFTVGLPQISNVQAYSSVTFRRCNRALGRFERHHRQHFLLPTMQKITPGQPTCLSPFSLKLAPPGAGFAAPFHLADRLIHPRHSSPGARGNGFMRGQGYAQFGGSSRNGGSSVLHWAAVQ
jgi:hypothetical protein